jgi:hypothetical protein
MWWKYVSKKTRNSRSVSQRRIPTTACQDRHQSADFEDIFEKVNEKGGK